MSTPTPDCEDDTPITPAEPSLRAIYERTAAARAAVDPATLPAYNLDGVYAGTQAVAIAERVAPYRDRMALLPEFDVACVDDFADQGNALLFVHGTLERRAKLVRELPELARQGLEVRGVFMALCELLVTVGKFPADLLAKLREGGGYQDLFNDLLTLQLHFEAHPDLLAPGSHVTPEHLARLTELVRALSRRLQAQEDADLSRDELLLERRKLAFLLVRSHRQIRRAMDFLRFDEGDAATLVPSLHSGGRPGRRSRAGAHADEPADPAADLAAAHEAMHAAEPAAADPFGSPFSTE